MPLTKIKSLGITDGAVVGADIADSSIALSKLSATGTASASTFLRGDNSWGSAGATAGQVIQVVSATDSTERVTSSSSFATGSNTLSVTITPSSASNKILILVSTSIYSGSSNGYYTIYRGATNLGTSNGMAASSDGAVGAFYNFGINYLDSPSTTSATTYQLYARNTGGGGSYMNFSTTKGSITCLEIKG
jgi:hypothetical protein